MLSTNCLVNFKRLQIAFALLGCAILSSWKTDANCTWNHVFTYIEMVFVLDRNKDDVFLWFAGLFHKGPVLVFFWTWSTLQNCLPSLNNAIQRLTVYQTIDSGIFLLCDKLFNKIIEHLIVCCSLFKRNIGIGPFLKTSDMEQHTRSQYRVCHHIMRMTTI